MDSQAALLSPPLDDPASLYSQVRHISENLCKPLAIEDYVPQPVAEVSPLKWNIAHTTWFFEEIILKNYLADYRPFNQLYGFLFNSYYNALGERTQRPQRGDLSRPTVQEIFAYRQYVDEHMQALFNAQISPELNQLIVLGCQHEQQHQELFLTDLKYMFGGNPVEPVYHCDYALVERCQTAANEGLIEIPAGNYSIGAASNQFHYDNECGHHTVYLDAYRMNPQLVTNREYIDFIEDNGYRSASLWLSDGWDWLQQTGTTAPLYWQYRDGTWFNYTLAGWRPVLPEAPLCHISYYEATAFCAWKEVRLPTEFEWEVASDHFDWGLRWEWTNSAYLPYPGYRALAGAVGEYNGKFMINQMVLRGASVATPANHSRKTYRNFFHPQSRWQFSGLRTVASD